MLCSLIVGCCGSVKIKSALTATTSTTVAWRVDRPIQNRDANWTNPGGRTSGADAPKLLFHGVGPFLDVANISGDTVVGDIAGSAVVLVNVLSGTQETSGIKC